jgi:hypothetical protein
VEGSAIGGQAPSFVAIGNPDLISRRKYRAVPIAPSGTLVDYVPFYFTIPFNSLLKPFFIILIGKLLAF